MALASATIKPGSLDCTPWARAAVGDDVARRRLRERVPAGFTLSLSARSPRGPFHLVVLRGGNQVLALHDQPVLADAIDRALATVAATS